MRKVMTLVLLLVVWLLLAAPVGAQDVIEPDRIVQPTVVFAEIVALLGVFAAGVGPLAQAVTSVYKFVAARYRPEALNYLPGVALIVPVVLTLLFWAADMFGLADLYVTVGNQLITLVPVVLSMLGAILGQAVTYQTFKKADAPLVGKTAWQMRQRSDQNRAMAVKSSEPAG